ncbi:type 1 fimbrial protein [Cupriavidus lacunae]|uniref:Type 1 fimbrial protein n=2 Tax=Cupriavidus lacunae TaxID=2666307 RepID=A0A370NT21_9BURK|nr:type 1 fimbrial protein [Cupriavidus lacunae]
MSSWAGVACLVTDTTPHSSPVGVQISVALVKTGQVPSGGIVGGTVAQIASIDVNTVTSLLDNVNITNVRIVPLLCTTPDVTVNMGTHRRDEFSGIGTFTSPIGFNIALNNCPAGMNSVSYRVDAVTTIVNASNSVVALDGSSTAAGVGVQLLDDTGSVFPLGTAKTMSGYSTGTGGSYAIPLKARYYQTGATVTAGTANSAMTFTMTYQ